MNPRFIFPLIAGAIFAESIHAQGIVAPLLITFDGPPILSPGSGIRVQLYSESGFQFQPTPEGIGFGRTPGDDSISAWPYNGSAYLRAALGSSLMFGRQDGGVFELLSVDLAEYSTVLPNAVTVQFIGYYADGRTIFQSFTTDGIIDGTGPVADFQTFNFFGRNNGWDNLIRVEIPTSGWSLDNLVVRAPGIPEPSAPVLWLLGAAALWGFRPSRQGRRTSASPALPQPQQQCAK